MTSTDTVGTAADAKTISWTKALARYRKPDTARSVWEIAVTAIPFVALWALTAVAVTHGHWWGLILTVPAAGFLVRLFMLCRLKYWSVHALLLRHLAFSHRLACCAGAAMLGSDDLKTSVKASYASSCPS